MINYIKNFITLLLNINKNPRAFTYFLISLIFLGANYALTQWFNTSLSPELTATLTEILFPVISMLTALIGSYYTRLVNTGDSKWTEDNVAGKEAVIKE